STIRIWVSSSIGYPASICFTVTRGDQTIVEGRLLDGYEPRKYRFEVVAINNGNLVCVYEPELVGDNASWLIIVDFEKRECWPPSSYSDLTAEFLASWKERYRLLRQVHPGLAAVSHFDSR